MDNLEKNLIYFATEFDDGVDAIEPLPDEVWQWLDGRPENLDEYGHFMLCMALYYYCMAYHGGQASEEYAYGSTVGYVPGAGENGLDPEEDEAACVIHDLLVDGEVTPIQVVKVIVDHRKRRDAEEEE
jgi:hypothetical protein